MVEDHLTGTGKQVSGSIKEAIGKLTGDTQTQAEGAGEKAAGLAENKRADADAAVPKAP